jgi:acyl carrier protein
LRTELRALIETWDLDLREPLRDDTSLIRSGLLDSVALVQLVAWLEEQTGGAVDPSGYDLVREWDTIEDILCFVDRHRAR